MEEAPTAKKGKHYHKWGFWLSSPKQTFPKQQARRAKILAYARKYGRITRRETQRLCPETAPRALRYDCKWLVDTGKLRLIRKSVSSYYVPTDWQETDKKSQA